jgi:hypothetical protein
MTLPKLIFMAICLIVAFLTTYVSFQLIVVKVTCNRRNQSASPLGHKRPARTKIKSNAAGAYTTSKNVISREKNIVTPDPGDIQ